MKYTADHNAVRDERGRCVALATAPSREERLALAARVALALNSHESLLAALVALADRADATGDCDHKRQACEDVGCIGAEVRVAREAIRKAREG